jgi:hypothetical protein
MLPVTQFIVAPRPRQKPEAITRPLRLQRSPAFASSARRFATAHVTAGGSRAKNWPAAEAALLTGSDTTERDLVSQIGQLFGDAKAAATQLAALKDASVAVERRREILQSFARDSYAPALPVAIALLDDAPLRRDAIRALAAFDHRRVPDEILRRYAGWSAADRAEAVLTLAARKTSADSLLAAVKNGAIPKRDISAFAARQLQRVIGPAFVDFSPRSQRGQAGGHRQIQTAAERRHARARQCVERRAVFERTCAACHTPAVRAARSA